MYVGIDIGGTKTLIGTFNKEGELLDSTKIETPKSPSDFFKQVREIVTAPDVKGIGVGVPGSFDSEKGIALSMMHVNWKETSITSELNKLFACPVKIQNDANLAGLSESIDGAGSDFAHVLYITISTGIGTGIIVNQQILPALEKSEGGHMPSVQISDGSKSINRFEEIASGTAIKHRYGKFGYEIDDDTTWKEIAADLGFGISGMMNLLQPDVIVIGGGIGVHFDRYHVYLLEQMEQYKSPIYPLPPLVQAQRPQEATLFGCFHLIAGS